MPPLEFWPTVDAAYFVGAFVVSLILGLLGIGRVNKNLIRGLLVVSFVIMGLGLWSTAQRAEEAANLRQSITDIRLAVTGGDNYVYLTVRPVVAQNGENLLAFTTTGPIPRSDFSVHGLSEDGRVMFMREHALRPLPQTTAYFRKKTLPPGRFKISFVMGEKRWTEYLDFERTDEGVDQIYWVERDGIVILEGPE